MNLYQKNRPIKDYDSITRKKGSLMGLLTVHCSTALPHGSPGDPWPCRHLSGRWHLHSGCHRILWLCGGSGASWCPTGFYVLLGKILMMMMMMAQDSRLKAKTTQVWNQVAKVQWVFQDPNMEVLYQKRGICSRDITLHRPYIWQVPPFQDPEIPIER